MTKQDWDLKTYKELKEMFPGKKTYHWHWGFYWIMENKFRIRSCMRLQENGILKTSSEDCIYPNYKVKINHIKAKELITL